MSKFLTITDNAWMLWCLFVALIMVELSIVLTFILTLGSRHGEVAIDQYINKEGGES